MAFAAMFGLQQTPTSTEKPATNASANLPTTVEASADENSTPSVNTQPADTSAPNESGRRHSRKDWWDRKWRRFAPSIDENGNPQSPNIPEQVPSDMQEMEHGDNVPSRRRHSRAYRWHKGENPGEVTPDGSVQDSTGYGYGPSRDGNYPPFRYRFCTGRICQGGPERSYIFREFDFL